MINKEKALGIADGREITVKIRIPKGNKCRSCKAKIKFSEHDFYCLLYGRQLGGMYYQSSEQKYGKRIMKCAVDKCEECLNGSQNYMFDKK